MTLVRRLRQAAIQKSLLAGAVGIGIVVLFMLFYYRLPGLLADIALILYAGLTFAVFKIIGVTMSLAGITGFILSIGMAVDANVLIFERVKEEIRAGRLLASAIDIGWSRAWPSNSRLKLFDADHLRCLVRIWQQLWRKHHPWFCQYALPGCCDEYVHSYRCHPHTVELACADGLYQSPSAVWTSRERESRDGSGTA